MSGKTIGGVFYPDYGADEDRTPMTRTELAMLWDLLNRWDTTHVGRRPAGIHIAPLRADIAAPTAPATAAADSPSTRREAGPPDVMAAWYSGSTAVGSVNRKIMTCESLSTACEQSSPFTKQLLARKSLSFSRRKGNSAPDPGDLSQGLQT